MVPRARVLGPFRRDKFNLPICLEVDNINFFGQRISKDEERIVIGGQWKRGLT